MTTQNKGEIFDDDLTEEEAVPPVQLEQGFARFIVVDNIPIVTREKETKLLNVLKKLFSACGTVVDIFMPFEGEKSKGFAVLKLVSLNIDLD
jgi:hypothetical protein